MVVDDSQVNLNLMTDLLQEYGYQATPINDPNHALEVASQTPPDLVLMDIEMPGMNGFEACKRLKAMEALKDVPVIFISGLTEATDKVKAYHAGGVDFVTKPYQIEEINIRIQSHLQRRRQELNLQNQRDLLRWKNQQLAEEIKQSQTAPVFALANLAEHHDNETGKHMERCGIFCNMLAGHLRSLPRFEKDITDAFIHTLTVASSLHDIGKVGIPDTILLKPGKLTEDEFGVMKTHTFIGSSILKVISNRYPGNQFVRMGISIAQSHHERWDGSGYPQNCPATTSISVPASWPSWTCTTPCGQSGTINLPPRTRQPWRPSWRKKAGISTLISWMRSSPWNRVSAMYGRKWATRFHTNKVHDKFLNYPSAKEIEVNFRDNAK